MDYDAYKRAIERRSMVAPKLAGFVAAITGVHFDLAPGVRALGLQILAEYEAANAEADAAIDAPAPAKAE